MEILSIDFSAEQCYLLQDNHMSLIEKYKANAGKRQLLAIKGQRLQQEVSHSS